MTEEYDVTRAFKWSDDTLKIHIFGVGKQPLPARAAQIALENGWAKPVKSKKSAPKNKAAAVPENKATALDLDLGVDGEAAASGGGSNPPAAADGSDENQ